MAKIKVSGTVTELHTRYTIRPVVFLKEGHLKYLLTGMNAKGLKPGDILYVEGKLSGIPGHNTISIEVREARKCVNERCIKTQKGDTIIWRDIESI